MDAAELEINRLNTAAFIAANPTSVVLTPVAQKVRTPSGGNKTVAGAPRPAQTFRIIETSSATSDPNVQRQDGELREVEFQLLGMYDAAIAKDDTWSEGDRDWRIRDVVRDNGYERRAIVVEAGD